MMMQSEKFSVKPPSKPEAIAHHADEREAIAIINRMMGFQCRRVSAFGLERPEPVIADSKSAIARSRGLGRYRATEFVCECLCSFGFREAPASNIALTFAAAPTSPRVDADSNVKPVYATQACSEAARRHLKFNRVRKVTLDGCRVPPAFIATLISKLPRTIFGTFCHLVIRIIGPPS